MFFVIQNDKYIENKTLINVLHLFIKKMFNLVIFKTLTTEGKYFLLIFYCTKLIFLCYLNEHKYSFEKNKKYQYLMIKAFYLRI